MNGSKGAQKTRERTHTRKISKSDSQEIASNKDPNTQNQNQIKRYTELTLSELPGQNKSQNQHQLDFQVQISIITALKGTVLQTSCNWLEVSRIARNLAIKMSPISQL